MEGSKFKDGTIPDFGEKVLCLKNGEIKMNDLKEIDKFRYITRSTEEQKEKVLKEIEKDMTAAKAAHDFINYCKRYGLTLEEMKLTLQYLEDERQSLVKKALNNATISDL